MTQEELVTLTNNIVKAAKVDGIQISKIPDAYIEEGIFIGIDFGEFCITYENFDGKNDWHISEMKSYGDGWNEPREYELYVVKTMQNAASAISWCIKETVVRRMGEYCEYLFWKEIDERDYENPY